MIRQSRCSSALLALVLLASFLGACEKQSPTAPSVPGANLDFAMVTFSYQQVTACTELCGKNVRFDSIPGTWPEAFDLQKLNHDLAPEMSSDGSGLWTLPVKVPARDNLCVTVLDPSEPANGGQTGLRISAMLPNGTKVPIPGSAAQACFNFAPPDRLTPVK